MGFDSSDELGERSLGPEVDQIVVPIPDEVERVVSDPLVAEAERVHDLLVVTEDAQIGGFPTEPQNLAGTPRTFGKTSLTFFGETLDVIEGIGMNPVLRSQVMPLAEELASDVLELGQVFGEDLLRSSDGKDLFPGQGQGLVKQRHGISLWLRSEKDKFQRNF